MQGSLILSPLYHLLSFLKQKDTAPLVCFLLSQTVWFSFMKDTSVSLTLLWYDWTPNKMKLKARNKQFPSPLMCATFPGSTVIFIFLLLPLSLIFFYFHIKYDRFPFLPLFTSGNKVHQGIPFMVTNYNWFATFTFSFFSEWKIGIYTFFNISFLCGGGGGGHRSLSCTLFSSQGPRRIHPWSRTTSVCCRLLRF